MKNVFHTLCLVTTSDSQIHFLTVVVSLLRFNEIESP
jgi:hypothetical protein